MIKLKIYTDGACSGNPGPGGWGAIIDGPEGEIELSGGTQDTTNNRMEMQAVIEALQHTEKGAEIELYTDSQYVQKGLQEWLEGWKRRGWKNASKKPVLNKDLWEILDQEYHTRNVRIFWVKGHAGHPGNERADQLAVAAIPK